MMKTYKVPAMASKGLTDMDMSMAAGTVCQPEWEKAIKRKKKELNWPAHHTSYIVTPLPVLLFSHHPLKELKRQADLPK